MILGVCLHTKQDGGSGRWPGPGAAVSRCIKLRGDEEEEESQQPVREAVGGMVCG